MLTSTVVNLFPVIAIHNLDCFVLSFALMVIFRRRDAAVMGALAITFALTMLWPGLGFAFKVAHDELLIEPVFGGGRMDGENITGLLTIWLAPILAAVVGCRLGGWHADRRRDVSRPAMDSPLHGCC